MGLADEFQALKAVSIEELEEQAAAEDYLTPREFAKMLKMHPQQVYDWIRKGRIEAEKCKCGRSVVCVSKAKAAIEKRQRELGRIVDPTNDPRYQPDKEELDENYVDSEEENDVDS